MKKHGRYLFTVLLTLIGCASARIAQAEIFKCTGSDGKISYRQVPCANEEAQSKVVTTGPNWEMLNRRVVGDITLVTYLDGNRMVDEGSYKRIRLRTERRQKGAVLSFTESEQVYDCVNRKYKSVAVKGAPVDKAARRHLETAPWFSFDRVAAPVEHGMTIERACSGKAG